MPTEVQPPPQELQHDVHNRHANVVHRDALYQALGSILAPKRPGMTGRSSSASTVDSSRSSSGTASPAHGHPAFPHPHLSPHGQLHSPAPPPPPPHSTPVPHPHPHQHIHSPSPLGESASFAEEAADAQPEVSCPYVMMYPLTALPGHPGRARQWRDQRRRRKRGADAHRARPAHQDHRLAQEQARRMGRAHPRLVLVGRQANHLLQCFSMDTVRFPSRLASGQSIVSRVHLSVCVNGVCNL
ncbi:hypothetical protein DFH06DRAFT_1197191 [Mycena polygramma]|nr:hypothetical protein DFH06DRAFT_1197191 [Mycena polygramma]